MGNQLFKYALFLLGAILLLAGLYLLLSELVTRKILIFNLVIAGIIYFANIFTGQALYVSSLDFNKNISGLGISLFFTAVYTISGTLGIIAAIYFSISFGWQLLYQLFFLLIFLAGIYITNMANNKMNNN